MTEAQSRRTFLAVAGTAAVAAAFPGTTLPAADAPKKKFKLAVKYEMISGNASPLEKFELLKKIGYDGCELDSPKDIDKEAVVAARDKTGIVVHGVVDSIHWKDTLSSPDESVRAKGLAGLETAIRDCKLYGGTTALLVPGVVNKDATFEQAFERSQIEVKKVLPLAKELGVKIAIEVVWNNFITTPDQLCEYIDAFKSEQVGAYFDCSNMLKYGVPAADWIRKLDKRLLKFDFKGYHIPTKKWVSIGKGSEEWPDVLKALDAVGYCEQPGGGWATSEVGGGDEKRLTEIYNQMRGVLGMS